MAYIKTKYWVMFKTLLYIFLLVGIVYCGCSQKKYTQPTVKIYTHFGDIIVELYPEKAPVTVHAFLSYVDAGYYTNSSFYRVLKKEDQPSNAFKSELIQGGLWQTDFKKFDSIPGIEHESTKKTGILHKDGVISLARADTGTASTEFFICLGNQPVYDYGGIASSDEQGFAAFGKVISGMSVVRKIHQEPDIKTSFMDPIEILYIERL